MTKNEDKFDNVLRTSNIKSSQIRIGCMFNMYYSIVKCVYILDLQIYNEWFTWFTLSRSEAYNSWWLVEYTGAVR